MFFVFINLEEGIVIDISKPVLIVLHFLTALSAGRVEQVLFRSVVVTTFLQK